MKKIKNNNFDNNNINKGIKIIYDNDNNNPIIIKKYNNSLTLSNILYDTIILPKEKISSPYNNYKNISLLDILDISFINKDHKLLINKNKYNIKNRSLSCDSLLNFYIIQDSMYRNIYNKYLAFHNIVHK